MTSTSADKIYFNANVLTFNEKDDVNTFIAVKEDKILKVGSGEDYSQFVGESTVLFDLEGDTVLPGFIESHNHFNAVANQWGWVDVGITSCTTIPEVLEKIKIAASEQPRDREDGLLPWIKCVGFDDTLISELRDLEKEEIDAVSGDLPVWIWHPSLHRAYVNSKALEIAGIPEDIPNPEGGGIFVRNEKGKLTGQMEEMAAYRLVYLHLNKTIDIASKCADMWATGTYFASKGVTSVHDLFVGPMLFKLYQGAFRGHSKERPFPIRVTVYTPPNWDRPETTSFDPKFLKFGGTKLFADGSIQCHTACCLKPYHDKSDVSGDLLFKPEQLEGIVTKLHNMGRQIAVHCNGDGAIEAFINAVENANKQNKRDDHRHRIEHCQMVTPAQLARMSELGIVASFFVGHVFFWGDRHKSIFLGPERSQTISPLKTAVDCGVPFGLHSDCPVTPVDPLHSMWTAVTRKTKTDEVLGSEEKISIKQALRAYTIDAAFLNFEEDIKGSLEAGKLADFIVLSENPLTAKEDDIPTIGIKKTVVGGRVVFASQK